MYKTRMMAARAVRPLVSKDQIAAILQDMVASLPGDVSSPVPHNYTHGMLLQVGMDTIHIHTLVDAFIVIPIVFHKKKGSKNIKYIIGEHCTIYEIDKQ